MPYYATRHVTRYRYSAPIRESQMEARMQPRGEGGQRCWEFQLETTPRSKVVSYRDGAGNVVHHFDVPGRHTWLTIVAEGLVEVAPAPAHAGPTGQDAWAALDEMAADGDHWELLHPSRFARPTPRLDELARELDVRRGDDPWTTLLALNKSMHAAFEYVPHSTRVDSPIDDALLSRQGVCQDFAHIMTALVRPLGIPCRYVSGYLYHGGASDRSAASATHAWIEAFIPGTGWAGLDPTNDLVVGERHIRVAVGRDYVDVTPTRGVYKGEATTELGVSVEVVLAESPLPAEPPEAPDWVVTEAESDDLNDQAQQQQQGR